MAWNRCYITTVIFTFAIHIPEKNIYNIAFEHDMVSNLTFGRFNETMSKYAVKNVKNK